MNAFNFALGVHVAAGFVAISVFAIPLFTKKGGTAHRRAGWVYTVAMFVLSATAALICAARIAEGRPAKIRSALFFLYVAVLSAEATVAGLRALAPRARWLRVLDVALFVALAVGGAGLAAWGVHDGAPLFIGFGMLGMLVGAFRVRFFVRPPTTRTDRILDHMTGMGISCIATLTAFLVLNAPRLGLGRFSLVAWFLPAVIGTVAIAWGKRRYKKSPVRVAHAVAALLTFTLACAPTRAASASLDAPSCTHAAGAPSPAFTGLLLADGGVVGREHHFFPALALPEGTPITVARIADGAKSYEAETVMTRRAYAASDLDALRTTFRAMTARALPSSTPVIDRAGRGYTRAAFVIDYAKAHAARDELPTGPGADLYPSYTAWFVAYGWEDGAIMREAAADGAPRFRLDPNRLYANVSSTMRLPEWTPPTSLTGSARAAWARFRCALEVHESFHIDTGRAVAKNVLTELAHVSANSREELETLYYFVWREGIAWGHREDDRIDAYTGHGPLL